MQWINAPVSPAAAPSGDSKSNKSARPCLAFAALPTRIVLEARFLLCLGGEGREGTARDLTFWLARALLVAKDFNERRTSSPNGRSDSPSHAPAGQSLTSRANRRSATSSTCAWASRDSGTAPRKRNKPSSN